MSYFETYKCNLCGETFQSVIGVTDVSALNSVEPVEDRLMQIFDLYKPSHKFYFRLVELHHCADGSLGIADFIGLTKGDS